MRDFVDFIKYIVKDRNEEIDEQNIGNQEISGHGDGGDPLANHAFPVTDVHATRRVNIRSKNLAIKHEVGLIEHLEINRQPFEIKNKKHKSRQQVGNMSNEFNLRWQQYDIKGDE